MTGRAWVILDRQARDAHADAVRVYNADFLPDEREERLAAAQAAADGARAAADGAGALLGSVTAAYRPRDREGTLIRPGHTVSFRRDDGTAAAGSVIGTVTRGHVVNPGRLLVASPGRTAPGDGLLSPLGAATAIVAGIRAANPPAGSGRHSFFAATAADALDRAASLYAAGQEAAGSLELSIALQRAVLARDKAKRATEGPTRPQLWELEDLSRAEEFLARVRPLHDAVIGAPQAADNRTRYLRYDSVSGNVSWHAAPTGAQYLQWVSVAAALGGTLSEEDPPPMEGQPRGAREIWEAALAGGWPAPFAAGYRSDLITPLTEVTAYHPSAGTVKITWLGGRQSSGTHTLKQALQLIRGRAQGPPEPAGG